MDTILQKIAIWAIPVLFAITVHETAHGWVANKLGDKTAYLQGRLTLNPIPHIDPIGTILVPLIFLSISPFIFGWAKPVPVDARNLRNPKRDMAWVALAGPLSNFMMALLWGGIMKIGAYLISSKTLDNNLILLMGQAGIIINLVLAFLNLIPIPPLDGSRVVASLLPFKLALIYNRVESIGFLILIALLVSGVLSTILSPLVGMSFDYIINLYNMNAGRF